jgi:hypothetical protein
MGIELPFARAQHTRGHHGGQADLAGLSGWLLGLTLPDLGPLGAVGWLDLLWAATLLFARAVRHQGIEPELVDATSSDPRSLGPVRAVVR